MRDRRRSVIQHLRRAGALLVGVLLTNLATPTPALAQQPTTQPPRLPPDALRPSVPRLLVKAARADSWNEEQTNVIVLRGGVELGAGDATLRAADAVLWLQQVPGEAQTRVDVVLLGTAEQEAVIETPEARQSGQRLAANVIVDGVTMEVPQRQARDLSASPLYQTALPLRPRHEPVATTGPATEATTKPAVVPLGGVPPARRIAPVQLVAKDVQTTPTDDGTVAVLATGGVFLMQRDEGSGDLVELRADRAVVFTTVERLDEAAMVDPAALGGVIGGVYLEGDVRIVSTPGRSRRRERAGTFDALEQRLEAKQAYYDFLTDQAILTRAVLHTTEPAYGQPLTLRAEVLRQLAKGQYEAQRAQISTSRMATPDYSLNASRIFVRTSRDRAVFGADNVSAKLFDVPVFWFPAVRGATLDNRLPLRGLSLGDSSDFGFGVETTWGLFETFNASPPQTLDATYNLGYLGDRGLTAGIDADYYGDLFLFGNRPETFRGELTASFVDDHGEDSLGGSRLPIDQDEGRGRFFWEHAQHGSNDWSAHARLGVASDPTFLEEWQRQQFWDGPPHDLFFNLDRSTGSELLGIQVAYDLNDFATTADTFQENSSVQRLPEGIFAWFGQRMGPVTLNSRNRVGALKLNTYGTDPVAELGLVDRVGSPTVDESFTGIPAWGYTGSPDDLVARGDFRQEISVPLNISRLSVTPFAVGRVTAYNDQINGDEVGRALGGLGVRVATTIVGINDKLYSRIFDIDRVRHLIEPSVTGFVSWQSEDSADLFIFDQGVDDISDVDAVQFALRQRWQTKRGAPGQRRNVDAFAWNLELNFFDDARPEVVVPTAIGPASAAGFRGLFFASEPEASLARDGINTDALWRISDTTALVGDATWSFETDDLATLAGGIIVTRDDRLSYSLGGRYVEPLDLTLALGAITYNLSQRYTIGASASYDFDDDDLRNTNLVITRRFERFYVTIGMYLDNIDDDQGFRFMVAPVGFRDFALSSSQFMR